MDVLLKNLELEEKNLILNSGPETPPSNRYNSVFSINGQRILPPLMTLEKRREMQSLKAQAISIERRLQSKKDREEHKQQQTVSSPESGKRSWPQKLQRERGGRCLHGKTLISDEDREKQQVLTTRDRLAKKAEARKKPIDAKALRRPMLVDQHTNSAKSHEKEMKSKKTLIIPVETDSDEALEPRSARSPSKPINRDVLNSREQLEQLERTANLNYVQRTPPMYKKLYDSTTSDGNEVPGNSCAWKYEYKALPSINVSPPTPQIEDNDFHSMAVGEIPLPESDSNESLIISDVPPDSMRFVTSKQIYETRYNNLDVIATEQGSSSHLRSEDIKCVNYQNVMPDSITQCDVSQENVELGQGVHLHPSCSNSMEMANHMENNLSSLANAVEDCGGGVSSSSSSQMNRSITSPSIHRILNASQKKSHQNSSSPTKETPPSPTDDNSNGDEKSTATTTKHLIRSNSFVLDYPSKVLIEHMRQQNAARYSNLILGSSNNSSNPNSNNQCQKVSNCQNVGASKSALRRLTRDTVESKAKKVQKPSPTTTPSKTNHLRSGSQQGQGHQHTAMRSTGNCQSSAAHISISVSANHVSYANKRSPYDPIKSGPLPREKVAGKASTTTSTTATSGGSTTTASAMARSKLQAQKSFHAMQNRNQHNSDEVLKPLKSSHTIVNRQPAAVPPLALANDQRHSDKDCEARVLEELNEKHRQSLLNLLAKQDSERRKLHELFEKQQEQLVEQLSLEMMEHIQSQQTFKQKDKPFQQPQNCISPSSGHRKQMHNGSQSLCRINAAMQQRDSGNVGRASPTTGSQSARNPGHLSSSPTHRSGTGTNSVAFGGSAGRPAVTRAIISTNSTKVHVTTTPRRHLFIADGLAGGEEVTNSSLHSTEHTRIPAPMYTRTYSNSDAHDSTAETSSEEQEPQVGEHLVEEAVSECRRTLAANTINAFVRGYLVRRLLRTEYVRHLIQTIHDTLIFLVKLHQETQDDPRESHDPANQKLQQQLFQQLSASSRSFYETFFEIPLKERLLLIQRDRRRILNKKMHNTFQDTRRKLYN